MNAAITYLESTLEILETNEPINRAGGDIEQADLEARHAIEIKRALQILKGLQDVAETLAEDMKLGDLAAKIMEQQNG